MDVSAGLTHTMIINSKGKVFSWGWNDNGQCAKPSQINEVILGQQSIKNAQVNFEYTIDKDK
jgi:alpha-tubulin suppressor-like RCC1 family protein